MQGEEIVETKICKHCSCKFEITDKDLRFYEKVSPIFNGVKYTIPTPTLCPDCRRQRRLSWRNESKLYKNIDSITKKELISIYSPDKKFIIYNQDYWWSDKWNPLDYGRDFDFNRGFFEQFSELQLQVPRITLLNGFQENADYGNHSYHNKNSYLVHSCSYVEDSYFCINTTFSTNCMDCYNAEYSNHCYEIIDSKKCNSCCFLLYCRECFKCVYCDDCIDCKYCIGCKGLNHKEYHVFNKQVSKEEFDKIYIEIFNDEEKRLEIFKKYQEIRKKVPSKGETNINCKNTFASDSCTDCENIKHCFECSDSKDIAYCFWITAGGGQDCYDYDIWGENSNLVYDTHCGGGGVSNILFCNIVWGGHHNTYCDLFLSTSSNCFGCIGLHNNEQYCIFNKQYEKGEYEKLVSKIIKHMIELGEWGEFFPSIFSPFGYNESISNEWFPLNKKHALKKGFKWSDYEQPFPKVDKIILASKLPNNIKDIPDDILNRAIECEITKKPFRIIKQELDFYRKHNLPIPKRHPDQRHLDRMALRNPRKLFDRKCDKCEKDIKTTYSSDRSEIVYCEECYNKEVY
ncbi:MAG: hypothetical protein WC850_05305 [Candidatus Gracilibacteria bacterium]